jgi:uncharacterized repeat protein (TIGR03803 family)
MRQLLFLAIIFSIYLPATAQVQFAASGGVSEGKSSLVSSFTINGNAAALHEFKITDPTTCYGISQGPDGNLYGTTESGGSKNCGVIFSVFPDGSNFKIIYDYKTRNGFRPLPAFGPDGKLYVVISDSLFKIALNGSSADFIAKVAQQCSEIVIDQDGWLYGFGNEATRLFFKIKTDGTAYTVLRNNNYNTDGIFNIYSKSFCITPSGRIFLACGRGANVGGTLVSMNADGSNFLVHKSFSSGGSDYTTYGGYPGTPSYKNGKIYINTQSGATNDAGALLAFDTLTAALSVVYAYTSAEGITGSMASGKDQTLIGSNKHGLFSIKTDGSNLQQINPAGSAAIPAYDAVTDKVFYISGGGAYRDCYLMRTDLTTHAGTNIHNFGFVPAGYNPDGVTLSPDGLLYGIAQKGGTSGGGTLFKMDTNGSAFAVIKDFNGNDGQFPFGQLLAATDGRLYGICKGSGINGNSDSLALFGINTDGTGYAVLKRFSNATSPVIPELAEGSNGALFGVSGKGTGAPLQLFTINKNGTGFTILKTLSATDGYNTNQGLIAANGNVYGMASDGGTGAAASGTLFRIKEDGTNFSIVKNFVSNNTDGVTPGSLALGRDNKLYGITTGNFFSVGPTMYSIDLSNLSFKLISSFSNDYYSTNKLFPYGKPVHATDNKLYVNTFDGIFGIDLNGTNKTLDSFYLSLNSQQVSYLVEIPQPVTAQLCAPVGSATLQSTASGTVYQWQLNTGTGFTNITDNVNYAGANGVSLAIKNAPSVWNGYQYRCVTNLSNSVVYTLSFADKWTGSADMSWENPANWSCNELPDANTDVIINSGSVVINSNVTVRSLTIKPGVNFTINNGFTLTVTH